MKGENRMKKRIAIISAVVFALTLFTGTIAYAGNFADKVQTRIDRLEKVRPLLQEVVANRTEIKSLNTKLRAEHLNAKANIKKLLGDVGSITNEQIEEIQSLAADIRGCRNALAATNPQMVQYRQELRTARRSRDYAGIEKAYGNIIGVQEARITQINKLIELNQKIAAL